MILQKIFYGIIPITAFLIIFANAFFGHLLFLSDTEQVSNKYSVYTHLQSEWNSDSKNLIFEVTNSWYKAEKTNVVNSVTNAETKGYNKNQLEHQNNKSYVELKHEFSNCEESWQPMLYRKAVDTVRHEIEYVQGKQLSENPDISVYPNIENTMYDNFEQQSKIKTGYVQFFPICTSKESTSYDYSIKTDNGNIGFDVYFVPSSMERENFFNSNFSYYESPGCFAQNKQSYSGTCKDISKDGGLLVIFPDDLRPWVTKVTVNLYEQED